MLTNPLDVAKTRLQTQAMVIAEDPTVGFRVATASASSTAASPELQVLARSCSRHMIHSSVPLWGVRLCLFAIFHTVSVSYPLCAATGPRRGADRPGVLYNQQPGRRRM